MPGSPSTAARNPQDRGLRNTHGDRSASNDVATARRAARERIDRGLEHARRAAHGCVEQANDVAQVDRIADAFLHGTDTLPLPTGTDNPLAERIGPVWTLAGAAARMPGRGNKTLGPERLRQRVTEQTLVGLFTRDRKWVLPAWQFRAVDDRLVVSEPVIALWRQLPHDPERASDWTIAAWMASPLGSLGGSSPLAWLERHGLDDTLADAAGRVRARTAA